MRTRLVRNGLLIVVGVFLAIQFIPMVESNPAERSETPAPPEVAKVLRRACYNCHSNETVWPLYAKVAPVSWLVSSDVQEGREELNFSTWLEYNPSQQAEKRKDIGEEIQEGKMPPWYYVMLHPEARLSNDEQALLRSWSLTSDPNPVTPVR